VQDYAGLAKPRYHHLRRYAVHWRASCVSFNIQNPTLPSQSSSSIQHLKFNIAPLSWRYASQGFAGFFKVR
jgi:hypothetical protein